MARQGKTLIERKIDPRIRAVWLNLDRYPDHFGRIKPWESLPTRKRLKQNLKYFNVLRNFLVKMVN